MKKKYILCLCIFSVFCAGSTAFATDDLEHVLGEVNNIQNTISIKTPEGLKNFFGKVEIWRISRIQIFETKRDEQGDILHPYGKENTLSFNEEGNIEIQTGIQEARSYPAATALLYVYIILIYIFSTVYLFYALIVLIVLTILKIVLGSIFQKE
ncbi:MAG: hypothetical protein KBB88_00250 [Candidatus Pacebacteria bacterium]|nr:hypothetical protein [Candidatus Paceibacterota bacterium]